MSVPLENPLDFVSFVAMMREMIWSVLPSPIASARSPPAPRTGLTADGLIEA